MASRWLTTDADAASAGTIGIALRNRGGDRPIDGAS
jgi:hypothetical protein